MRKFIIQTATKTALATAALLATLVMGAGVAHALPNMPNSTQCHVGGGGELWCEDWDTGQSWEAAPGGSYQYTPYCGTPYAPVHSVQCGD